MPYIDEIWYSQDGETEQKYDIRDKFIRRIVAPEEASSTASRAYAVGEPFIYNNLLYRATAAIAQGGTITPGTNCETVPGGIGGRAL